jgi:hypothetical protein
MSGQEPYLLVPISQDEEKYIRFLYERLDRLGTIITFLLDYFQIWIEKEKMCAKLLQKASKGSQVPITHFQEEKNAYGK